MSEETIGAKHAELQSSSVLLSGQLYRDEEAQNGVLQHMRENTDLWLFFFDSSQYHCRFILGLLWYSDVSS